MVLGEGPRTPREVRRRRRRSLACLGLEAGRGGLAGGSEAGDVEHALNGGGGGGCLGDVAGKVDVDLVEAKVPGLLVGPEEVDNKISGVAHLEDLVLVTGVEVLDEDGLQEPGRAGRL